MFNEGECARGVKAMIEPRIGGVKGGDERSQGRREKEKNMNKQRTKNISYRLFLLGLWMCFLCVWTIPSALSQNRRPVLGISSHPILTVAEDNTYGPFTTRQFLAELLAAPTTDPDVPINPPQHLLLFEALNLQGAWQFTTNGGGTWSGIPTDARSGGPSYMVWEDNANHQIRYVPNANYFTMGSNRPRISFRAWDRTEQGGRTTGEVIQILI